MSLEWVVTGIILLGAMLSCGIILYVKRRREAQADLVESTDVSPNLAESEKDDIT